MARGKVAEWIRKRTMPRKPAAKRQSSKGQASEPILREAAMESCSSAAGGAPEPTPRNTAGSRNGAGGGGALPAHSKSRAKAFLSAALTMRLRPRVKVVAVLCEKVVYPLMWLVESVVLVGRLCFFLMRFGFKQL